MFYEVFTTNDVIKQIEWSLPSMGCCYGVLVKEFWHITAKGKENYYHKCFMSLIWNKRKTRNPSRYCPFIFSSHQPDAKSAPSTGMVHYFIRRTGMFPRGSHHIFNITFLPSEVVCYVCLNENQSDNISLVHSNIALCSNLYSIVLSYVHAVHVYWVQSQKTCAKKFRK